MAKRYIYLLFSISLIFANSQSVFAQWQQLTGLKGEPCYFINSTSSELFTGTSAGVLSSSNSGTLWAKEPDLYLTNVTNRISTSGDSIVVYADPESYLSVDNGVTWTDIPNPAGGAVTLTGMTIADGMLYAGTDGDYFYKSSDLGVNWIQVISNLTTSLINFTAAFDNVVLLAADDGIYRSTDKGVTFNLVSQIVPGSYYIIYTNGNDAFAYGSNGIVKSNNNGASWIPYNPAAVLYADITDFLVDGTTVYAATFDKLMKSDVSTNNWSEVTFGQNVDFCFGLCKKGSDVYAATCRGVFKTSNQGVAWTEVNDGITPVTIESLTIHKDKLFAGASIYGISSYQNAAWTFSGLSLLNGFDLYSDGVDIYSANELGIYKSLDTGATWNILTPIGTPLPSFSFKVTVADTLIIGAAVQNGILRSGDDGANWTVENTGMPLGTSVSAVAISGNNVIAGSFANGLLTSTDGGFSWNPTGAAGAYITDLTAIGNTVIASTSGSGNFISTDNGSNWTSSFATGFDDLSTSGFRVIASTPNEIYLSEDSGSTYLSAIPGPPGVIIANSCASDSMLYVSTYTDGVWMASISELLGVPEFTWENPGFKILPNFFTEEAMIVVEPDLLSQNPSMIITDASGKMIKKFKVHQTQTRLLGNEFAPGVYFCTVLKGNQVVQTQKFIVN